MSSPLVDALAAALRHSDDVVVGDGERMSNVMGRFVGLALIRDEAGDLQVPVFLAAPAYWTSGYGVGQNASALAEAVVTQDGSVGIRINDHAYACGLSADPRRQRLAEGLIAHEMGHVDAGHLRVPPAERPPSHLLDCVDRDVWGGDLTLDARYPLLAAGLLARGCYPMEVEADDRAIALVGLEPVLALLTHCAASEAMTLANRMECDNRIARHLSVHGLARPRRRKGGTGRRLEWGFLSEEQIFGAAAE